MLSAGYVSLRTPTSYRHPLQALRRGLPIVVSHKAAVGYDFPSDGSVAAVADEPDEIIAAVVRLYSKEAVWSAASAATLDHAHKLASADPQLHDLTLLLKEVIKMHQARGARSGGQSSSTSTSVSAGSTSEGSSCPPCALSETRAPVSDKPAAPVTAEADVLMVTAVRPGQCADSRGERSHLLSINNKLDYSRVTGYKLYALASATLN
jgi:hypothetical protein